MFHQLHPINSKNMAKATDMGAGTAYPLILSMDKFLDLLNDVKSLEVAAAAIVDNSALQALGAFDMATALALIDSFGSSSDSSHIADTSSRRIKQIGNMKADNSEPLPAQIASMLSEYPVFTAGGQGGIFTLDFGKTLFLQGSFLPYCELLFSNGMGSTRGGAPVGGVSFSDYGHIPIYGGDNVNGLSFLLAEGVIEVKERFSDLVPSTTNAKVGEKLTFTAANPTKLDIYKWAYFGSLKTPVVATAKSLQITVPQYAKSGPIRIESEGPLFDFFLTPEIKISS